MTALRSVAAAALVVAAATGALAAPAVHADSFHPIRMTLHVTAIARRGVPLPTLVDISADPGVLDGSEGPLRMEVKLAPECGATFQTTPGVTLVDAPLDPSPRTGRSYSGSAAGSGRPTTYGIETVCMFLEDTDVGRVYANDESATVDVSPACTADASRYDADRRALARSRRRHRGVARHRRIAARARRTARAACGSGVTL